MWMWRDMSCWGQGLKACLWEHGNEHSGPEIKHDLFTSCVTITLSRNTLLPVDSYAWLPFFDIHNLGSQNCLPKSCLYVNRPCVPSNTTREYIIINTLYGRHVSTIWQPSSGPTQKRMNKTLKTLRFVVFFCRWGASGITLTQVIWSHCLK
jgi:hypothetical protein